jgi:hypothetical protein
VRVSVPGGPAIRAPFPGFRDNADYYAQIIAHPRQSNEPASLALRTFSRERIMPAGLPDSRRWDFTPPEQFDAGAFLRNLQNDLLWETVGESTPETGGQR